MKTHPLVSTIIPTYNREKYIKRAIESVFEQTYKNIEIIVVDDGSTDNTKKILTPFIKSKKIRYFYQKNAGPAVARNLGIKNSKGEFIAFLDSDDEWLPEKLEKQIKLFQNSKDKKLGFVACNIVIVNEKLNKTIEYKISRYENFFKFLLSSPFMWLPSIILTPRKVLEEVGLFDENLWVHEDWDMWIRIARKYNFDFVPELLTRYYLGPSWVAKKTELYKMAKAWDYITRKFQQDYQKFPELHSTQLRLLGSRYFCVGETKKGRSLFLKSIKINPLNIKSYFYFLLSLFGSNFYQKIYRFTLKYRLALKYRRDDTQKLIDQMFLLGQ